MNEGINARLLRLGYIFQNGEWHHPSIVVAGVRLPKLEPAVQHQPDGPPSDARDRCPRVRVRVTSFTRRPLDDCNFSTKALVDCVRYSGIIADDNWGNLEVVGRQKKVGRDEDTGTEIVIEELP